METFRNNLSPKNPCKFICEKCNFISSNKKDYNRHIMTLKHTKETNGNIITPPSFDCDSCSKHFTSRSGLWKHSQKCNVIPTYTSNDIDVKSHQVDSILVIELLKQNNEFKQLMVDQSKQIQEQNKQIIDLAKNSNNTTNNTTTNNTTNNNRFNLNVFLNETCKDAINLNDFIQSIELTITDFINTGEVGYVKGISNIMVERIREMEPHTRPIHCTDLKREILYVKDSNIWAKEDDNKTHLRKAVRIVANKNKDLVHPWREENPNYEILDTPECDKFFEYTKASLGGYGKEEDLKFENKIISNVMKETVINKNLLEF